MNRQLVVWGSKISIDWEPVWENGEIIKESINFVKSKSWLFLPDTMEIKEGVLEKEEQNQEFKYGIEVNSETWEVTFNGKKVKFLKGIYLWEDIQKEAKNSWLTIPNIEELKAFCEDYIKKFPNWEEDNNFETARNPLWLFCNRYWSSTEDEDNHHSKFYAYVLNMDDGFVDRHDKDTRHSVICFHD
jgi:hypothetical protein